MRISDWSSDVCSSDLQPPAMLDQHPQVAPRAGAARAFEQQRVDPGIDELIFERVIVLEIDFAAPLRDLVERRLCAVRSDERRVVTEGVSTGRVRWWQKH